jgi:hypothetical protein
MNKQKALDKLKEILVREGQLSTDMHNELFEIFEAGEMTVKVSHPLNKVYRVCSFLRSHWISQKEPKIDRFLFRGIRGLNACYSLSKESGASFQ